MNISRNCINLCVHCVKQMSASQLEHCRKPCTGLTGTCLVDFMTINFQFHIISYFIFCVVLLAVTSRLSTYILLIMCVRMFSTAEPP